MANQIEQDMLDGIRRAIAIATYEATWDWFSSYKCGEVMKECLKKTGSLVEMKYLSGVHTTGISSSIKGTTKMSATNYLKIIKAVYPEHAKMIEAELRHIERLRD